MDDQANKITRKPREVYLTKPRRSILKNPSKPSATKSPFPDQDRQEIRKLLGQNGKTPGNPLFEPRSHASRPDSSGSKLPQTVDQCMAEYILIKATSEEALLDGLQGCIALDSKEGQSLCVELASLLFQDIAQLSLKIFIKCVQSTGAAH